MPEAGRLINHGDLFLTVTEAAKAPFLVNRGLSSS